MSQDVDVAKEVRMALLRDIAGLTIDDMLEHFKVENHPAAAIADGRFDGCGTGTQQVVLEEEYGAEVLLWCWIEKTFRIHYYCNYCEHAWEDEHDCACNDKCPTCNRETEPHDSEEIYR